MLLRDKVVLVTGASKGSGRAVALGCAREGAHVALNYFGEPAGAQSAAEEIQSMGRRSLALAGDVGDPEVARRFVQAATEALGGVDVLVSNAGICPFHSFLDMPVELVERTVSTNLLGAYYMCQAAARRMVEQGRGGALIAVSSISALVGGAQKTHYTPTKAGVHSLMQSCAIALGPHGVRCNSVLPGTIETDINRDDLADPAKRRHMEARTPLGRFGEPEDLVRPVVFLASDMARYVTGAALLVDGGMFVNLQ